MGRSVQFHNAKQIIDAYLSAEVPAWAIWHMRDLMTKYSGDSMDEGQQLLEQWLQYLKSSAAIYTIKLYERPGERITTKTDYDHSFNFTFADEQENVNGWALHRNGALSQINEQFKQINDRLDKLDTEEGEEGETVGGSEDRTIGQQIGTVMMEALKPMLPAIAQRFADYLLPQRATQLGNVQQVVPLTEPELRNVLQRLENAMGSDPGLLPLLSQLAALAEKKPGDFKMYMGMLMKMNL